MRQVNKINDSLLIQGSEIKNSTLADFLMWAYSDLCDDVIKGIFAEWMVAKLLGIPTTRRYEWSNSDLFSTRGTKIEVKASSYWQSWKAISPDGTAKDLAKYPPQPDAKIRFSGLMAKDTIDHHKEKQGRFKSDLYVFCFQNERNYEKWNAMNLSQWEFYLVPAKSLTTKSVSLQWLKANRFGPLNPSQLSQQFNEYENTNRLLTKEETDGLHEELSKDFLSAATKKEKDNVVKKQIEKMNTLMRRKKL